MDLEGRVFDLILDFQLLFREAIYILKICSYQLQYLYTLKTNILQGTQYFLVSGLYLVSMVSLSPFDGLRNTSIQFVLTSMMSLTYLMTPFSLFCTFFLSTLSYFQGDRK